MPNRIVIPTSPGRRGRAGHAALLLAAASVTLIAGACARPALGVTPAPSASTGTGSAGAQGRGGAGGELVQIHGQSLILSSASGDVTVTWDSSTTFTRTANGTIADVVPGRCLRAGGSKDAQGNINVSQVQLASPLPAGTCPAPGGPGGPGGGPRPVPSGTPGAGAGAGRANFGFVNGLVTTVSGSTVSVNDSNNQSQTVTLPPTVRISITETGSSSDLKIHECLRANGPADAKGSVAARAITIVPMTASGCATGGRGGFFGGGRGPGGRPGGGPGGGSAPGAGGPPQSD